MCIKTNKSMKKSRRKKTRRKQRVDMSHMYSDITLQDHMVAEQIHDPSDLSFFALTHYFSSGAFVVFHCL